MRFPALALLVVLATSAQAGTLTDRNALNGFLAGGGTSDDFEGLPVTTAKPYNATSYDVGAGLDSATVIGGQAGRVQPGVRYSHDNLNHLGHVQMTAAGDGYLGLRTTTLVAQGRNFRLDYTTPIAAMGLDLFAFQGYRYTATATVYSGTTVLGSVPLSVSSPSTATFFGWVSDDPSLRITSVLFSVPYYWYTNAIIDNHTYGVPALQGSPAQATPEPVGTMVGLAGLGLALFRRRSAKG